MHVAVRLHFQIGQNGHYHSLRYIIAVADPLYVIYITLYNMASSHTLVNQPAHVHIDSHNFSAARQRFI